MSIVSVLAANPVNVSFPGLGINNLPVNRIAFELFNIPVYWYGLLFALSIILSLLLAMRHADHYGLKADDVMDVYIFMIPIMIIFARLYYVVFEWDYYSADWKRIFNTREGGLAFYGGVIGGIVAIYLVTRFKKIALADFLDFIVVYVPLAQAIGRWGNFFNQEAFGTNTKLPWGMISTQTMAYISSIPGLDPALPVHPTFLYEFIANLLIFLVLVRVRRNRKFAFQVTLVYLLSYGLVRFFVEGIRTDALMVPGSAIRVSQVLSAAMVVLSALFLVLLNRRANQKVLTDLMASDDFIEISPDETGKNEQLNG
jgi:phosphatidylglycerol:prolipoprotein diacylglycerol transferase